MQCSHVFRMIVAFGILTLAGAGLSAAKAQDALLPADVKNDQPSAVAWLPDPAPMSRDAKATEETTADALLIRQRYQAAIAAYQQADPNSSAVWNKMGMAYQMMFNLRDAARCYQVSLKLNPNNSHVLNNLGTIYNSQKLYGAAERVYRKAIRLAPNSALIYRNLGSALLAEHKYEKGWEAYKAALSLDPHIFVDRGNPKVENPGSAQDRGAMNYYMARGCIHAGMNDCAIDHLRRALNEGFTDEKKIEADSEFAGLREIPAFQQLLAEQKLQ